MNAHFERQYVTGVVRGQTIRAASFNRLPPGVSLSEEYQIPMRAPLTDAELRDIVAGRVSPWEFVL